MPEQQSVPWGPASHIDGDVVDTLRAAFMDGYTTTLYRMQTTLATRPNIAHGVAEQNGVRSVLAVLLADPALAAAALGLERGVESQINTPDAITQQRDVLRYPWRTTDA
jgi:hypothetical protein